MIAPIEYRHPNASGASVPPNDMEALSVIDMATYVSGLPVVDATSDESCLRMVDLSLPRSTFVVRMRDLFIYIICVAMMS